MLLCWPAGAWLRYISASVHSKSSQNSRCGTITPYQLSMQIPLWLGPNYLLRCLKETALPRIIASSLLVHRLFIYRCLGLRAHSCSGHLFAVSFLFRSAFLAGFAIVRVFIQQTGQLFDSRGLFLDRRYCYWLHVNYLTVWKAPYIRAKSGLRQHSVWLLDCPYDACATSPAKLAFLLPFMVDGRTSQHYVMYQEYCDVYQKYTMMYQKFTTRTGSAYRDEQPMYKIMYQNLMDPKYLFCKASIMDHFQMRYYSRFPKYCVIEKVFWVCKDRFQMRIASRLCFSYKNNIIYILWKRELDWAKHAICKGGGA